MYRGVVPFILLQLIGLALVMAYPQVVNGTIAFFRSFW